MFRLLALKVLEDCAACAHKVLSGGMIYFFCQDYQECMESSFTLTKSYECEDISLHFYDVVSHLKQDDDSVVDKTIQVSLNAIVGKNGDGKSSIVELLLRVINNFACTFGYLSDQDTLAYNISVSAILYYEL